MPPLKVSPAPIELGLIDKPVELTVKPLLVDNNTENTLLELVRPLPVETFTTVTLSVTSIAANISGTTNSIPYFSASSTLTSSVISQISNNILIGTTSNIGSRLYIAGSFSSTGDGIINNLRIGRANLSTNIVIGNGALNNLSAGSYNIAIGDSSLTNTNNSSNNIAIGYNSSNQNTSASDNITIGNNSFNITNTSNNVVVGNSSSAGGEGVSVGTLAGRSGFGNISIGQRSGNSTIGGYNVFLGYQSGINYTGSYSVFIGGYTASLTTNNNILISDGQGNLRIYVPSSGNVLIGTMSDNGSRLQIAGSMSIISATGNAFRLVDGTQGSGRILKSDSQGYSSWQPYKYSGTQSFTGNSASVISHNLNTMFYMIQLFDYTTGEEILGDYTNRGLTQATITLTQNVTNCGVVIIG